ncbi:hypothetical protein Peur_059459 [Populus x canadensis]
MEQGLSLENTPFTNELTFQFDADDLKIPPKSLSRVNPEGIGDNDIEVDHLEARNARKHFNSKDFPQKRTLVTESDHDDTEALKATKLGTAFDLPRMESSVNYASERNLHYGIGK